MSNIKYSIVKNTPDYLLVKDEANIYNEIMSLTNGAERLVTELFARGLLNDMYKRLFYIDTDGIIDEIIYSDGKFDNFSFGHSGYNREEFV